MQTPKVYLISRELTEEQREKVLAALSVTPLAGIIAADPRDIQKAVELCPNAETLQRPIGILADFAFPLTAVNEDGSLCPLL
jgi:hypothetical protein